MTEICIFYVCENNCLHFFHFIHTLIIIYIRVGILPVHTLRIKSWTLSSKGKILESNTQNTAVQ